MNKTFKLAVAAIACVSSCALAFSGCGRPRKGDVGDIDDGNDEIGGSTTSLNLWVPSNSVDFYQARVDEFLLSHKSYNVNIQSKDAGEVYNTLKVDPDAGADVFLFSGEYVKEFEKDGLLHTVSGNYAKTVRQNNNSFAVAAIDRADGIVGFPATLDNGWFLWYNSEFYNQNEVNYFDDILIKAREHNKQVRYMYYSFWYAAAFFNGAGCEMDYADNGVYRTDIDSANGIAAAQAMYKYYRTYNDVITAEYDEATVAKLNNGSIVAAFGGAWMGSQLNANIFPAVCPIFIAGETSYGEEMRMSPYVNGTYFGVNSKSKNKTLATELADFLSNYQSQFLRYSQLNTIPSNANVMNNIAYSDKAVEVMQMQCGLGATYLYRHTNNAYREIAQFSSECYYGSVYFNQIEDTLRTMAQIIVDE